MVFDYLDRDRVFQDGFRIGGGQLPLQKKLLYLGNANWNWRSEFLVSEAFVRDSCQIFPKLIVCFGVGGIRICNWF